MFIVCNFPQGILRIMNSHKYYQDVGFQIFRLICNLAEFLNASVNFYVYFLWNKQIREEAKLLFKYGKDQLTSKPKRTSYKTTKLRSAKKKVYDVVT